MATERQFITGGDMVVVTKRFPMPITNGAFASSFVLPVGAVVRNVHAHVPTAVPGTPTTSNLRLGSAADGAQYVANTDIKAQGFTALTLTAAARVAQDTNAATWHVTVASSGGTAADQDTTDTVLYVEYLLPA